MKKIMIFTIILIANISASADDPGERDSIIVETVFVELGDSTVDVRIYATCDDSVIFYNLPLTWNSYNGTSIYPSNVSYFNAILLWRWTEDTVFFDESLLLMTGWIGDFALPLFTNNSRMHCWTVSFTVDSLTLPQIVIIDTTQDPVNGSLFFGLAGGTIGFAPEFVPGAIFYGVTSDNYENEQTLPTQIALYQNYPNPFNAQTTIEFTLPVELEIVLAVYDLLGRRVETLIEGVETAGQHSVIWNANDVTSGIYFYQLSSEGYSQFNKMTLIR